MSALMITDTTTGVPIDTEILHNYFKRLVNLFFKILPMRENGEDSLITYMQSLQSELLGCKNLITAIHNDPDYLTILSILQYLIDNPECSIAQVKREVFRSISICNKLQSRFMSEGV